MRDVEPIKAVVREGRLILDVPTDLPEGKEVELVVVDDVDAELLKELEASERDEAAGNLVDFDAVVARLGTKPREVAERLVSSEGRARLAANAAAARRHARAILESTTPDAAFLAKRVTT